VVLKTIARLKSCGGVEREGRKKMTNQTIITNFINGATSGHTPMREIQDYYYTTKGCTLSIAGNELINYTTVIATRDGDTILLNNKKYSRTTSKIQSLIKRIALSNDKIVEEIE